MNMNTKENEPFNPEANYRKTKEKVGYVSKKEATRDTYEALGFKCGLEIHQQLLTKKKLFCRCPAGVYNDKSDFDAEVVRHMRPTLSELGEYDGTALMEFKTKKNIFYHIKNETACTYEIDDTPPFALDREALERAIKVSLLLNLSIVGEFHITRKQYLDGSIPTGFQRTGIIGIEGEIPLKNKKVRIIQLSLEEDSCREVSDVGHNRVYTTDRLGMPLIETVTYPDMLTPDEAAEAGQYLRFLARSSGVVRTGMGAARQDVNVSVTGGRRVEIKGVAHIQWIPRLTHNEAFRQWALLQIRDQLNERIKNQDEWKVTWKHIPVDSVGLDQLPCKIPLEDGYRLVAINLPQFKGLLSYFTQPGQMFANELEDRLKVIACLERPNMLHSEAFGDVAKDFDFDAIRKLLGSGDNDAQIIVWGPEADIPTAIETIEERCQLAFDGVPNETRKSLKDGTTIFERVLPGPDRMYPDTDSPPIAIPEEKIAAIQKELPETVRERVNRLQEWKIPADTYTYILKRNLFPVLEKLIEEFGQCPVFAGTLIGHNLKCIEGRLISDIPFDYNKLLNLFSFVNEKKLDKEIIKYMLPVLYQHPNMDLESVLTTANYRKHTKEQILADLPELKAKYREIRTSSDPEAETRWLMGQLRPLAVGNVDFRELNDLVNGGKQ